MEKTETNDGTASAAGATAHEALGPTSRYLLHLLACAVNGAEPHAMAEAPGADWRTVHDLAVYNSVEGCAWVAARTLADDMPSDLATRWEHEAQATLWRRLQFDTERERVIAAMDGAGLAHLPLKGITMAPCYPDPTMRSMADNDILYGYVEPALDRSGYRVKPGTVDDATKCMSRIMAGLGYEDSVTGHGNADCYYKKPCFNFEMHRILVQSHYGFSRYLDDPWAHALPDDPTDPHGLAFHFDITFEYVFHVTHAYKHYTGGGCGIRHVVDELMFLRAHGDEVDRAEADAELSAMGIIDFERQLRTAADELFDAPACRAVADGLSPASVDMAAYMLGAGTYGNVGTRVRNRLEEAAAAGEDPVRAKLGYLMRRVLNADTLEDYHPLVARHRWLLPFYVAGRLGKAVVRLPKVMREVAEVRRAK